MSLAYFPMYPDDYEADTAHLTMAEDGAYNRLLRLCWRTDGCSIPADRAWVYRRMRALTDEDRAVVDAVLDEFFVVRDGRYSNARLTKEWLAANASHERRKNAGAKGGKAKSLKNNDSDASNATAMPKQPEPEPEPDISKREAKASPVIEPQKRSRTAAEDTPEFAAFWNAYPRRTAKGDARTAFAKAIRKTDPATIIAAARRVEDRGQYTPHPATWLNGERWADQETRHEPDRSQQPRRAGSGHSLLEAAARASARFGASCPDERSEGHDAAGQPRMDFGSRGGPVVSLLAFR